MQLLLATNKRLNTGSSWASCETAVALGFVEGLNNKIRVIERRTYDLRDEDYRRLKPLSGKQPKHCK
jgi:transposase